MADDVTGQRFIDEVIQDIVEPGVCRLLDSRYFTDLRLGKLTIRRLQGFAIQHYIHNMAVLKGIALAAVQRATVDVEFMGVAEALNEEIAHPAMSKKFGLALGLTQADFDGALPAYGCLLHTAVVLHGIYLSRPVEMLANLLSNETMVGRYAAEFDTQLRRQYDFPEDALEFFSVHKEADVDHTDRSAEAIQRMVATEEERERVRVMCLNMARLKLGKFDSIYDEYI